MSVIDTLVTDRTAADVTRWRVLREKGLAGMTTDELTEWLAGMKGAMPKYAALGAGKQESEEDEVITYEKLKDVPEKFRPVIDKLMTAGIIQGDGSDPTGNGDIINLTHKQVGRWCLSTAAAGLAGSSSRRDGDGV